MIASDFLSLKMTINYYILLYRVGIIKRKTYKHQYLGIFIFSLGIICFVLSNALTSDNQGRKQLGISIGLMLLAEFFGALHILFIEYFAWKLDSSSAEILTIKSAGGLILCGILYYPLSETLGKTNENFSLSIPLLLLFSKSNLIIFVMILIFLIGVYNFIFIYLLKVSESLAVCTVDSGRIVIVSIILAILNSTELIAVQIIAALCIFLGLSIYNEILILPFCGLKQSAKTSLKENKLIRRKREEGRMWIHRLVFFAESQNKISDFTLND
jgi:drug/metabolite transporter (DMT)-like permease